jgi:hypothetical protein
MYSQFGWEASENALDPSRFFLVFLGCTKGENCDVSENCMPIYILQNRSFIADIYVSPTYLFIKIVYDACQKLPRGCDVDIKSGSWLSTCSYSVSLVLSQSNSRVRSARFCMKPLSDFYTTRGIIGCWDMSPKHILVVIDHLDTIGCDCLLSPFLLIQRRSNINRRPFNRKSIQFFSCIN